jgi:multidrug efflux pump
MTSASALGSTRIVLQFDLDRDINGAARDVQAAINASRSSLPTGLNGNPSYRKVNPADAPIMILALTSDTLGRGQMYDAASSILQQKLSQLPGVGQVIVGGSSLPGVRVEMNPAALNQYGIALETVRSGLAATTQNRPKGQLGDGARASEIASNDQLLKAAEYAPVIVAYRSGRPVLLSDVARVEDSVEDVRTTGLANGRPAVMLVIFRQPGANIIDTVDGVRRLLPELQAAIPPAIAMSVVMDQTQTIRASLHDVELTLLISVLLIFAEMALLTAVALFFSTFSSSALWSVVFTLGFFALRNSPTPVSVPPLPCDATNAPTTPPHCSQISGPVVR